MLLASARRPVHYYGNSVAMPQPFVTVRDSDSPMPTDEAPTTRVYAQCPRCRKMLGIVPVGQLRSEHGRDAEAVIRTTIDKLVAEHECAAGAK